MDGVEEVVEQVVGGAVVAAQPDDAVRGEARAVLGDDVEEAGAAGAGGAGEADGPAAGEQPHQALAFVLAGQQAQDGADRSRRDGRPRGALRLGAFGRGELLGPGGPLRGRADLDLAAVDGVDREQEVAGHQLHRAGERGRVLSEVGGDGVPVRARARRLVVAVLAVLLRAPVGRVHWFKPPKSVVCRAPAGTTLPALPHTALSLLVRARRRVCKGSGQPDPKPSPSIADSPGCRTAREVTVS
ncbi:hypothetical protein STENM36S_00073 [Streptomyces tendae]